MAGAYVNCDEACNLCTGDPRVIVAVVDNCVQWDHPALAANMWTNTREQNGAEGRDDDSNGYVDDIHGFNFVDNTTLTISTKGDAPDHGTHVAGTVSAVNNNGRGVAPAPKTSQPPTPSPSRTVRPSAEDSPYLPQATI